MDTTPEPFLVAKRFDPRGIALPRFIVYRWENGQKFVHATYTDENHAHEVAKKLTAKA